MVSFKNKESKAYLNKTSQTILNQRILKFPINSQIKRKPIDLTRDNKLNDLKANQILEFFFIYYQFV